MFKNKIFKENNEDNAGIRSSDRAAALIVGHSL